MPTFTNISPPHLSGKKILLLCRRGFRCLVPAMVGVLVVSCGGGGGNVNAPKGNAIGERHEDFMKVVGHAKLLPAGYYDSSQLPAELRLKNLLCVYVDKRGASALEFPSIPIDSSPIYLFVEHDVPDPEGVVRAVCNDHGWQFGMKLDEEGWYYIYGP
jgi:hypothetical protein